MLCISLLLGKVFSWGKSNDGQLGLGDHTPPEATWTPRPITSLTDKVVRVSCGHSVSYAVTEKSELFSWGFGVNLQLGNGEEDPELDARAPTRVLSKKHGEPAKLVRDVSAGAQHAMFIAEFGLGMKM